MLDNLGVFIRAVAGHWVFWIGLFLMIEPTGLTEGAFMTGPHPWPADPLCLSGQRSVVHSSWCR
jgi:hypothetical protein